MVKWPRGMDHDMCPLCKQPDSCTHIGPVCDGLHLLRHHAAVIQCVHLFIRHCEKGGAAATGHRWTLAACDGGCVPLDTNDPTLARAVSAFMAPPQLPADRRDKDP